MFLTKLNEFITPDGFRGLGECENGIVVFDAMNYYNQKTLHPFFTSEGHKNLHVEILSLSDFDLPKRTIRNNSNMLFSLGKRYKM